VETAQSLAGGSGWVLLIYSRRQKRFWNQIATDHTQAAVDAAPVLVLDMYEHATKWNFGVNATAYIDTFFRNINWEAVLKRIETRAKRSAAAERRPVVDDGHAVALGRGARRAARQRQRRADCRRAAADHMSRHVDLMAGATWRDPDRVEEWITELTPDKPVAVYCAYGFDIGRNVTKTLIERGFDARFVRGGVSAWYASGGARALRPTRRTEGT